MDGTTPAHTPMWNTSLAAREQQAYSSHTKLFELFENFHIASTVCVSVGGTFGVLFSVLNIMVFRRLGLGESINVTFLGISVADGICNMLAVIYVVSLHPGIVQTFRKLSIDWYTVIDMTTSELMLTVYMISSILTAFAAIQRCVCVTIPMKVKFIFTATRAKIFIVLVSVFVASMRAPLYFAYKFDWVYDPFINATVVSVKVIGPKSVIQDFRIMSLTCNILLVDLTLVVCTALLCTSLVKNSKWRQTVSTSGSNNTPNASRKEAKATQTLIFMCILYLVCSIPLVTLLLMTLVDKGLLAIVRDPFTIALFYFIYEVGLMFQLVNTTLNIFIYYNTSSNFKSTLDGIFPFHKLFSTTRDISANMK